MRGSIFLNTSLTESFGIAILEAACAGLYVVSTRVGGVPEILPHDMISFAKPEEDGTCGMLCESNSGQLFTMIFVRLDSCAIRGSRDRFKWPA